MTQSFILILYLCAAICVVAEDKGSMFRIKLFSVLDYHVPLVLMDDVPEEDAMAFLMVEIKKGFGSVAEIVPLSESEKSMLSTITFSSPVSKLTVRFHGEKVSVRNLLNEICGQLKFNLVVLLNGSFNFIPVGVKLDPKEYQHDDHIYIQLFEPDLK